jgi:UDP-N-acetylmuramate dehydrogenase
MDLSFLNDLNVTITPHALLKNYTTFRLGGPCLAMIECESASVLSETIIRLRQHCAHFIFMGFGSNILASDKGIPAVIVRFSSNTPRITQHGDSLTVEASTMLHDLANTAVDAGLDGLSKMIGIPGTVGGAITGNAGAYGEQISDHLRDVKVLCQDNTLKIIPARDIRFSYRDSEFKSNGMIILEATFDLTPSQTTDLTIKRDAILEERKFAYTFWQTYPCAGSFFKNVEPTSKAGKRQAAGWFLENSGAKELSHKSALIYKDHANIVTHKDQGLAQDVYELTLKMSDLVKEKFGIELVREVRVLGDFDHAPQSKADNYW